jgi:hypothetical protein
MLHIGIDNGSSGGIAVLTQLGGIWRVDPMPPSDPEILELLTAVRAMIYKQGDCHAMLEHAQAFPGMGVSGAFNYGRGYGAMQMALLACGIPYDVVTPGKWQSKLGCLSGGKKNITKARAEKLFPTQKVTHAIADALLIAEYGRRVHQGVL